MKNLFWKFGYWLLIFVAFPLVFAIAEDRNSVKIVILGIAQDGGIPQIGCRQAICKTQHHFVSSLAVLANDSVYLIDATPDLRDQYKGLIQRYPAFSKNGLFDGIFLTHAHMGHYT